MDGEFEVFDSGGGWTFLFGKPLLRRFQAVHDFNADTVSIRSDSHTAILHNNGAQKVLATPAGDSLTSSVEQGRISVGGSSSTNPPSRQVLQIDVINSSVRNDESGFITGLDDAPAEETDEDVRGMVEDISQIDDDVPGDEQMERQGTNQGGGSTPPSREVLNHSPAPEEVKVSDEAHSAVLEYMIDIPEDVQLAENARACQTKIPWMEQDDLGGGSSEPPSRGVPTHHNDHDKTILADTPCLVSPVANTIQTTPEEAIFTRQTEPFLPARVAKILELVQIGDDVSEVQRDEVKQLITEFADCFALSLSEVNLIPGAVHKLDIPEGSTFRTKIPQRSFNPDQRTFMATKVQEMLKGGIIRPMHPREVRCVAPSVLAHKVHENGGLSLDELQHKVNDECVKYGLPAAFDLPPRPPPSDDASTAIPPKKWRLCQDFGEINKVTTIAPYPKATFAQSNSVYRDIGIYMCSILQQGSTALQSIQIHSRTSHSTLKDSDISHMSECPLESLEVHQSLGTR